MKFKNAILLFVFTLLSALAAVVIYSQFVKPEIRYVEVESKPSFKQVDFAASSLPVDMDFIEAAESTVHSVVHVKITQYRESRVNPLYEYFFGIAPESSRTVEGFGSGVIISDDGYIVTNNHVIEKSDEIEVVLNDRRIYSAKLVGADPYTDIALLKISEKNLPVIKFGSSDDLKLGEWVLAVGNPFNLTSTVTAGIVSAKARNIGILGNELSIESFIQTDAAVNPGNSGGALVNASGQLVGINTAIASLTGYYSGYSFAIPVNIVKKVVADLLEFGEVQRAVLGVTVENVTSKVAESEGIEGTEGVYIKVLNEDGAAKEAGLKEGDVILAINDVKINSSTELQEQITKYRPNDKVKVLVKRKGDMKQIDVVLRNSEGNTDIVRSDKSLQVLGATFETMSGEDKSRLGIRNGVRVASVSSGPFMDIGIKKGFVVIAINKKPVNSVTDIADMLRGYEGGVYIEGIYPNGRKGYYAFGL